jgi:uncharacterized membrane protein AbrB (regulator of aidB expression)
MVYGAPRGSRVPGVRQGVRGPMRSDTEPNGNEMGSILKETSSKTWPILTTGMVAIPGGLLFDFLRIPLPWMLGPLTVTLLYNALSGQRAR